MSDFEIFFGIDYSGALSPNNRLPGLQVYAARAGAADADKRSAAKTATAERGVNWTRAELAAFLLDQVQSATRFLAGIDHNFSFPASYFKRYGLTSWPAFLDDFVHHWPTHRNHVYVDTVRAGQLPLEEGVPPPGQRTGRSDEYRLTERWTSSAKSVFHFDAQGTVAKSSHAGIPWLKWLRDRAGDRLHFWPFDGWTPPPQKSVLVEIYPSLYRHRYPRATRTADEQDAYACARWMADMAARGALADYFAPPLTELERRTADLEGWIFGVR